jgi:hypothetical protein
MLCNGHTGTYVMTDPESQCEFLLDAVLPFADRWLRQYAGFHPYAMAMDSGGQLIPIAANPGGESPAPLDVIALLRAGLMERARQGAYQATALVYDVVTLIPSSGEKSDAIEVALDHRDGYSVVVRLPYRLNKGEVEYGELFAEQGKGEIFTGCDEARH